MMICDQWEVVVVPFPFADLARAKSRPALVLSKREFNSANQHTVLAMITSSKTSSWLGDYKIGNLDACGLPVASIIRMKIFTLDNRLIRKAIGKLSSKDKKNFSKNFTSFVN